VSATPGAVSATPDAMLLDEIRTATAELIAAAREADTERMQRALARRGHAVGQLSSASAVEQRALDDQAQEALAALTALREGAREAQDALSRSAVAIRGYESSPTRGQALDQSA
jgi:hypothetical protein